MEYEHRLIFIPMDEERNKGGHLYIDNPSGKILIDTGSPISGCVTGKIAFGGDNHDVPTDLAPLIKLEELFRELQEDNVIGLIGTDILNHYDRLFDIPGEKLTTNTHLTPMGEILPSTSVSGTPSIPLLVNGHETRALFDTGAPVAYFGPQLIERPDHFLKNQQDFFPALGEMGRVNTPVYHATLTLGGIHRDLACGAFTNSLTSLGTMGMGIVGSSLMTDLKVGMSHHQGVVWLEAS